ncbi:MAG: glycosyltransferase family 4 protein [Thermodesulfobacteriota bacterium]|nr:glycosyltransferase family 4 protein [Thermodesulfobacteriota bacterium]
MTKNLFNSILLTTPDLNDQGGVSGFYNALFAYLPKISVLEIGGTKGQSRLLHPVYDQLNFRKTIIQQNPSLVHLNPSLGFKCFIRDGLFAWQAKQRGVPVIVFWHGWDKDFERKVEERYLWLFKKTFGRADHFIVLASEFKKKFRDWGVTATVSLGTTTVDEKLLNNFSIEKKLNEIKNKPETIKILFLARLEPAKGVFETLEAVRLLLKQGFSLSLTIAGDGKCRSELEMLAASYGLTELQIKFTGDIRGEEKIRAFKKHHIYCLPSSYGEGLPNSVLEAMAFGMPVVTRPVGGLKDVFQDGKMGWLSESNKPAEIAECLKKMIENTEKTHDISRYNYNYAKEHFMASRVAERLIAEYNHVLAS